MSNERMSLTIVSVNVALPTIIGERHDEPIVSGIRKAPVVTQWVDVTSTGIVGDGQADLVNHGGVDKAVYAYPAEHLLRWSREHNLASPYGPGAFGENLTVQGMVESDALIGDRWQWGEVVLEICQPRYPCYKLATVLNRPSIVREMVRNRRTGWYLRVLQTGEAPASGAIEVVERGPGGVSVIDAHLARLPDADPVARARVAGESRLASRLRSSLIEEESPKG